MERLDKPEDEIQQMMNEESWYVGQEAVDAGFCDSLIEADALELGFSNSFLVDGTSYSFQNYLKQFVPEGVQKKVQRLSRAFPQGRAGAFDGAIVTTQKGETKMGEKTVPVISDDAGLQAAYPQLCAQVAEEAVQAERKRLQAIDEIAAGIPESLLLKAKYEEPVAAADLALAQMKANSAAGQKFLAGMAADMQDSGAALVAADPNAGFDDTANQKAEREKKICGLANKLKIDRRRG